MPKAEIDQRNPAFTAGGNKDAEIATPTIEDVFSPNSDKAAAAPDANAMNMSKSISLILYSQVLDEKRREEGAKRCQII